MTFSMDGNLNPMTSKLVPFFRNTIIPTTMSKLSTFAPLLVVMLATLNLHCSAQDCTEDSACPDGLACNTERGKCYESCGNEDSPTGTDTWCQAGFVCQSKKGGHSIFASDEDRLKSTYDHECKAIENCDPKNSNPCNGKERVCDGLNRICIPATTCEIDTDCSKGFVCDISRKTCSASCTSSGFGCSMGYACDPGGGSCSKITSCKPGQVDECNSDGYSIGCDPNTNTCVSRPECASSKDCAGGFSCEASHPDKKRTCEIECSKDEQCASGYLCGGKNLCVAIEVCDPRLPNPCNAEDYSIDCDADKMVCASQAQCSNNLNCMGGYRCLISQDSTERYCAARCLTNQDCVDTHYCNASAKCVPKMDCTTDEQCGQGFRCQTSNNGSQGTCFTKCTGQEECLDSHYCADGACLIKKECVVDSECSGYRCETSGGSLKAYCTWSCVASSDCATGFHCTNSGKCESD
jgi:hypothetical protein